MRWNRRMIMAELTPMMQQYFEIKEQNRDCILFFRLGDFYEMFDEDARLASRELDLTLTSRDRGKDKGPDEERIPMCGIPYHAAEGYIARLIAKGYKAGTEGDHPRSDPGLPDRKLHARRGPQQLFCLSLRHGRRLRPVLL